MPDQADVMRERRDRELERQSRVRLPIGSPFTTKVVGVSFVDGYPDNLQVLSDAIRDAPVDLPGEGVSAILIHNPDNQADPNAVEVHVPALGEYARIGFLTRPVAARLAPELDAGTPWSGQVLDVLIDPQYPDRPGISIRCQREERVNDE